MADLASEQVAPVEILKDVRFAHPSEPSRYSSSGRSDRDWTLGEIEDAMWQARAAGATDDSKVKFSTYGDDKGLTVKDVPAFGIEVPPAQRRPATRYEEPKQPVDHWWKHFWPWVYAAGVALVLAFLAPLLIGLLRLVWRLA